MADERIVPSKIRTPIQLLAAWLVGLILVNGSFLASAATLSQPWWAPGLLVIAAVANVPIFLAAIFFLQTRFRPEMQEDEYYSKYLERRYSTATARTELVEVVKPDLQSEMKLRRKALMRLQRTLQNSEPRKDTELGIVQVESDEVSIDSDTSKGRSKTQVEVNDLLPRYAELVRALRSKGVRIGGTFGSTSLEPQPPEQFIISVGMGSDMHLFQEVVRIAMKFGLRGVGYANDAPMDENRIYVGAYGYDEESDEPYALVDEIGVEKLFDPSLTWDQFRKAVRAVHQHRQT